MGLISSGEDFVFCSKCHGKPLSIWLQKGFVGGGDHKEAGSLVQGRGAGGLEEVVAVEKWQADGLKAFPDVTFRTY